MRRRVLAPVAAGVLPAYLAGCFHYVPAQLSPAPKPETEVRVTLTRPLDIPMGEFTLNQVTMIEGVVAEAGSIDTLGLVAKWLYPRVGRKYNALFGSYGIPVTHIQQLEEWRLSLRTTAIALGVSTAVLAVVFHVARHALSGGEVQPPPPDVTSIVGPR